MQLVSGDACSKRGHVGAEDSSSVNAITRMLVPNELVFCTENPVAGIRYSRPGFFSRFEALRL